MRKKIIFILLIALMVAGTPVTSPVFSYEEGDAPYEENKNFRFSLYDIDSQVVKDLYDPDNTEIPERFSLKDELMARYGITIPVGDQIDQGICDTFAPVKSVETNYALKSGTYIDLSERYLDYMVSKYFYEEARTPGIIATIENDYNGQDGSPSANDEIMTFLETFGAAREEDVPYDNYEDRLDVIKKAKPALRVTSSVELPSLQHVEDQELKAAWMEILKIHIMKYGSINSPITAPVWDDTYNSETYGCYYKTGVTGESAGHAISIVGWDDNYSADNFLVKPEHDGAFIALNSWGESFGDEGYFYISYDDDNIVLQLTGVLDTEVPERYKEYSNSDKLITHSGFFLGTNERIYGIKYQKKEGTEQLSHITIGGGGFSNEIYSSKVRFYINPYDDSFDKDKLILLEETNSITLGSHSNISLKTPIELTGESFALVIECIGDEDDINFCYAQTADGDYMEGTVYGTNSLEASEEEWVIIDKDFPVFLFTISDDIEEEEPIRPEPGPTPEPEPVEGHVPIDIEIKSMPDKAVYIMGEGIDLTGGMVTITYADGTKEDIPMTSDMFAIGEYASDIPDNMTILIMLDDMGVGFDVPIVEDGSQGELPDDDSLGGLEPVYEEEPEEPEGPGEEEPEEPLPEPEEPEEPEPEEPVYAPETKEPSWVAPPTGDTTNVGEPLGILLWSLMAIICLAISPAGRQPLIREKEEQ